MKRLKPKLTMHIPLSANCIMLVSIVNLHHIAGSVTNAKCVVETIQHPSAGRANSFQICIHLEIHLSTSISLQNIYNIIVTKTFLLQVFKKVLACITRHGPRRSRESHNLKSISHNPQEAKLKIQKEVMLGRVCGPFDNPPYYLYKSHHWV
jgi:hypothetical protein